jgi:L-ribulokinase
MTGMSAAPRDRPPLVVGVDFGTLSGRAVVVRVSDGAELGAATHDYPHGVIDRALPGSGARLPPEWALQVPSDYVDVLRDVRRPLAAQVPHRPTRNSGGRTATWVVFLA